MALADLAAQKYEVASGGSSKKLNSARRFTPLDETASILLAKSVNAAEVVDLDLVRVELQSRRPVSLAPRTRNSVPEIGNWVLPTIGIVILVSLVVSVVSGFVFLLELSSGQFSLLMPSFSAFFVFSFLGLVSFSLNAALKKHKS